MHVRHEPGRFSTHAYHLAPEKINGIERGAGYLLDEGPRHRPARAPMGRGDAACPRHRRHAGLARAAQPDQAAYRAKPWKKPAKSALSYGVFRLRTLRQLLGRKAAEQDAAARSWTSIRSSAPWPTTAESSPRRWPARQLPRCVLKGMTGQKHLRHALQHNGPEELSFPRALRKCFRPGPAIPRQVARQQSLTPFRRTLPV